MRLSDIEYTRTFHSDNWRTSSRCLDVDTEMTPDLDWARVQAEEQGEKEPPLEVLKGWVAEAVQEAKRTCSTCVVKKVCLEKSEGETGIWGGLTDNERLRLVGVVHEERLVRCTSCGLDCVPVMRSVTKCDFCLSDEEKPRTIEDYREQIVALIHNGVGYAGISRELGFDANRIGRKCREWGSPTQTTYGRGDSRNNNMTLARCGTPAAKRRHQRRGESIATCACALPGSSNPKRTRKNGW